ncbi:MAG: hypothetical protein EHM72_02880 [Calditrichaeota bacterium]|nr:MAG: hypothetical protein EHM72_02880 [Calditrichota bacterium]
MSDLKNKLEQLLGKSRNIPNIEPVEILSSVDANEELLREGIRQNENLFGTFWQRDKEFNAEFEYGQCTIGDFIRLPASKLALIAGSVDYQNLIPEDLIFIDTETTGLAGGTGTYVFLVGLAFVQDQTLQLQQYLMPDLRHEKAMLTEIERILQKKKCLISYNGKAYDIPLLKTRMTLNRMSFPFESMNHIDLLYVVRRLWKKKLASCSLDSVERTVAGITRINDVSGSIIPSIYLDFLRNRSIAPLIPVLKHNVQDLLTMSAILVLISRLFEDDVSVLSGDPVWIFRMLCKTNQDHQALMIGSESSAIKFKRSDLNSLMIEKAKLLKRQRRFLEAVELWNSCISTSLIMEEAYRELAMFYEHVAGDFDRAMTIVQAFKQRIEIHRELYPDSTRSFDEQWQNRFNRLSMKISSRDKFS